MHWHMLSDRKTPGCCRAERSDGLVADGSDSCQDPLCVCVYVYECVRVFVCVF